MGIRVQHNYGGAAIMAGYASGVGKARERKAKYQMDWMREQQKLAQRREEMFMGHAMRLDLQKRGNEFQATRDESRRAFDLQRDQDQRAFTLTRDEEQKQYYTDRDEKEREFTQQRDQWRVDEQERLANRNRIGQDLDANRYSKEVGDELRDIRDKIQKTKKSGNFTDEAQRQEILNELYDMEAELARQKLPQKTNEELYGEQIFEKDGHRYQRDGDKLVDLGEIKDPQATSREEQEKYNEKVGKRARELMKDVESGHDTFDSALKAAQAEQDALDKIGQVPDAQEAMENAPQREYDWREGGVYSPPSEMGAEAGMDPEEAARARRHRSREESLPDELEVTGMEREAAQRVGELLEKYGDKPESEWDPEDLDEFNELFNGSGAAPVAGGYGSGLEY